MFWDPADIALFPSIPDTPEMAFVQAIRENRWEDTLTMEVDPNFFVGAAYSEMVGARNLECLRHYLPQCQWVGHALKVSCQMGWTDGVKAVLPRAGVQEIEQGLREAVVFQHEEVIDLLSPLVSKFPTLERLVDACKTGNDGIVRRLLDEQLVRALLEKWDNIEPVEVLFFHGGEAAFHEARETLRRVWEKHLLEQALDERTALARVAKKL